MQKGPKYKKRETTMPHIGDMLNTFIKKNRWPKSVIARKTTRTPSTIEGFLKRPSLQIAILWEISHATHYNFIADIAAQLPAEYNSNAPNPYEELTERIAMLEQQLQKMTDERDLLKEVLGRR